MSGCTRTFFNKNVQGRCPWTPQGGSQCSLDSPADRVTSYRTLVYDRRSYRVSNLTRGPSMLKICGYRSPEMTLCEKLFRNDMKGNICTCKCKGNVTFTLLFWHSFVSQKCLIPRKQNMYLSDFQLKLTTKSFIFLDEDY